MVQCDSVSREMSRHSEADRDVGNGVMIHPASEVAWRGQQI